MIRIYKDKNFKTVTKGAYDTFYKPLGYKIVVEETAKSRVKVEKTTTVSEQNNTRVNSSKRVKKGE